MALVAQFCQINRKVIASPLRPLPWSLSYPPGLLQKTTAQSQTLPTAKVRHHSHRQIPRACRQYFQYAWDADLSEIEYPNPLEVCLVVAQRVSKLVLSTGNSHIGNVPCASWGIHQEFLKILKGVYHWWWTVLHCQFPQVEERSIQMQAQWLDHVCHETGCNHEEAEMSIMVLYSWNIGGRCIMHSDANIFVILLAQTKTLEAERPQWLYS